MKLTYIFCFLVALGACKNNTKNETNSTIHRDSLTGVQFVNAFYSFNRDSLAALLSHAKSSYPEILYYQKWAECANYKILNRHVVIKKNDSTLLIPVTVKDDLMGSLEINFNVTDTFHVTVRNEKIVAVTTSSNDVQTYWDAKEWVKQNRPAYIDKACEGVWQGGPTPCECVLGMMKGFREFVKSKK